MQDEAINVINKPEPDQVKLIVMNIPMVVGYYQEMGRKASQQ